MLRSKLFLTGNLIFLRIGFFFLLSGCITTQKPLKVSYIHLHDEASNQLVFNIISSIILVLVIFNNIFCSDADISL